MKKNCFTAITALLLIAGCVLFSSCDDPVKPSGPDDPVSPDGTAVVTALALDA